MPQTTSRWYGVDPFGNKANEVLPTPTPQKDSAVPSSTWNPNMVYKPEDVGMPVSTLSSQKGQTVANDILEKTKKLSPTVLPDVKTTGTETKQESKPQEDIIAATLAKEGLSPEERQRFDVEEAAKKQKQDVNDYITSISLKLDASKRAALEAVGQSYQRLIDKQEEVNRGNQAIVTTAGIRSGAAKYTPEHAAGVVKATIDNGLSKVADLVSQQQQAIMEVNAAYDEKQFEVMAEKFKAVQDIEKNLRDQISKMNDEARKLQEQQTAQIRQSTRDTAIASLMSQGITNPVDALDLLNMNGGDFTAKEIGEAYKNLLPENKTTNDLGVDGRMFEFSKKQGWLPEGASIFDYWKLEAESKSKESQKAGMGLTSSFDQFKNESIALSALPPTLRNSDAEKEYYLSGIRSGLASGKTPYEVADTLMGYNITTPTPFSEGMRKYVSIAGGVDKNVAPELARLINGGNYDKAISLVENEIYKKIQSQNQGTFVSEADAQYVASKVKEVTDLLGEGWSDSIGPFEGTFNQALQRFRTRDYQKIKTKINTITADLINKRAGSALTEEEWNRLVADSVPSMTDKAGIFVDKLNELKGNPLTRLNAQRTSFELPEITEKQLFDRKERIGAYSSQVALEQTQAKSKVVDFGKNNPNQRENIKQLLNDYSYDEVAQILGL